MKYRWLFLFLISLSQLSAKSQIKNSEIQGYLLSSPASGNTWTRYIIEYLTGIPTQLEKEFPHAISSDKIDYSLPIIQKSHSLKKPDKNAKLILLVRNYKEIMLRYSTRNYHQEKVVNKTYLQTLLNKVKNHDFNYFRHLELYDSWDGSKRHLIYYEDLMTNPREVIMELIAFLDVEPQNIEEFFDNYQYHVDKVIRLYNKHATGSHTRGKDLYWHSKKLSKKELQKIDRFVQDHYPQLCERYLMRYLTPD